MKQKRSLYLAGIVLLALVLRLPRFLTAQVVLTEGTTYQPGAPTCPSSVRQARQPLT
jgi:hypothetical protein